MDWKILFICFIGSIAATPTNSGWQENTEYIFNVESRTFSGHPDVGNQYSGVIITSGLSIIVRSNGTLVAQLREPQFAKVHTKLTDGPRTHIPHGQLHFKKLPIVSSHFEIEMKNGVFKRIRFEKQILEWEVNIIKGLISQIQLDTHGENLINSTGNEVPKEDSYSCSYKTMEESILGKYEVLYDINQLPENKYHDDKSAVPLPELKGNGEIMEIVKTKNFDNADKHVGYHYGLAEYHNYNPLSNNMGEFFARSSISKVTISGKLNRYTIQSVETTNEVYISPAHNGDQKMMVFCQYKLSLSNVSINTFPPPPLNDPDNNLDIDTLMYKYNNPTAQPSDQYQEGNETSNNTPVEESDWWDETTTLPEPLDHLNVGDSEKSDKRANLVNSVIHMAKDIAKNLAQPGDIPKEQTQSKFLKMVQLIRILIEAELLQVADELYYNENDSQKFNAWRIFCDGLAESGTEAGLMQIQKLVVEKKVDNDTASTMILQMVKSARVPNYQYMRKFYIFITLPVVQSSRVLTAAVLFAYSRLVGNVFVHKTYSDREYPIYTYGSFHTPQGEKFVTDEFIPFMAKQLEIAIEQKDNRKAQTVIYSLAFVAHPKILDEYKKYLEGKVEVSLYMRTQIVYSFYRMAALFPETTQQVLYKLYSNPAENTDVRIAALQLLPITGLSASMFQKIATNIYFDSNTQVNAIADYMIRRFSKLQTADQDYNQINAQSAVHLLPKRKYGIQYSKMEVREHIAELKTIFYQWLYTWPNDDSLFQKTSLYMLTTNGGRLHHTMFLSEYVTGGIEALMKVMRNEADDNNGEQHADNHDSNSKWSSEQVQSNLNIKPHLLESPEAYLYFSTSGFEHFIPFDVHNLNLKNVIEDIKEALKKGKDVHITKFVNQHSMAMGSPTETGLPAWYNSDNPFLINIEGHVSGDLQTKEKSIHVERVDIDSRIKIVISKKMQDRIGFTAPFENQHYLAGHDVNAHAYLPLNMQAQANMTEDKYAIQLEPATKDKLIKVIQFTTVPYTSRSNSLKLGPVIGDSETHIINAKPKGQFDTVIGQNMMGMEWRVHVACEHRVLRESKLLNAIGDHSIASSLFLHLFHGYIHNSKLEISYDAEKSNKKMIILASHKQWKESTKSEQSNKSNDDNENESNRNLSDDARKLYNSQNPKEEGQEQVVKGLSYPTINLYELVVKFNDKRRIEYNCTVFVAKSDTQERTHLVTLFKKEEQQHQDDYYQAVLLGESHTPMVNDIDPFYALKHTPFSNSQMKLVFGRLDYDSVAKINASIQMSRSHNRNLHLQGSQIAQDCKRESNQGDLLLKACSQFHIEANSLDQIQVQIAHQNLKPEQQKMTDQFVQYVMHSLYEYMEQNSFSATGSEANNKVNMKIQFDDDFDRVSVTANTPNRDIQFVNVRIPSWLRPVIKVHPNYNAVARVQSKLYESQYYQASCAVDKTAVNTFDDKTYQVKQGNWTVMFLYVPNRLSKTINSHSYEEHNFGTPNQQKEEFLVLTRNVLTPFNSNREIKITVRTAETKHKLIEIDMMKKGKSKVLEVHVNQEKQNLHTDRVTEVANGFIKMIMLPNQELGVEIENAFTIVYDGDRARLTTQYNDKFRNKIRGLCGNFDSRPLNDWYAPQTCVYNNVEQFVSSYQPYEKDPISNQSTRNKCFYDEIIYRNVVLENEIETEQCTENKRVYVVDDNLVCISLKPVRVCKLGCTADQNTEHNVLANCIENDDTAQLIIKKIDDNEDLDESNMNSNVTEMSLKSPKHCYRPNI